MSPYVVDSEDEALLRRAAADDRGQNLELSSVALRTLSENEGLDYATALWFSRLNASHSTQSFVRELSGPVPRRLDHSTLFALVPGAFYREHKCTGADGGRIRRLVERLGCRCETIPIQSFGRVRENAAIISEWLSRQNDKTIVLVSLSKGSADVKAVFGANAESDILNRISAWVSFSGIVQGTPLVNWLKTRPLRLFGVRCLLWLRKQSFRAAEDLTCGATAPQWPKLPRGLQIIHVIGVPLRKHLAHPWALKAYNRLALLGPNDGGGILLGDYASVPGTVCPLWGVDHYLDPSWNADELLLNILATAAQRVAKT